MPIKTLSTNKYNKELKLMLRSGKDIKKLEKVIDLLEDGINNGIEYHLLLPDNYCLHKLSGKFDNHWECHIQGDWLLIYRLEGDSLILERTGTHSDLFK